MKSNPNQFVQFLLNQVPVYDDMILKDICPTDGWIGKSKPWFDLLPCDVRFLPNKLRPIWAYRHAHPISQLWRIAKKFRIKTQTAKDRLVLCDQIVDEDLRKWLKTLPKDERRRQVYKRRKSWRNYKAPQKWFGATSDRFRAVWPNVKSGTDLKSDWPPSKDCTGTPCDPDPWGPMRHLDD